MSTNNMIPKEEIKDPGRWKTILVDFDGVIHQYNHGWCGIDKILEPPVPGAIDWLTHMIDSGYHVCIYSARSRDPAGIGAMMDALFRWGMSSAHISKIDFPITKPAAFLTIDDRAICFQGTFPTTDEIEAFQPWYKQ